MSFTVKKIVKGVLLTILVFTLIWSCASVALAEQTSKIPDLLKARMNVASDNEMIGSNDAVILYMMLNTKKPLIDEDAIEKQAQDEAYQKRHEYTIQCLKHFQKTGEDIFSNYVGETLYVNEFTAKKKELKNEATEALFKDVCERTGISRENIFEYCGPLEIRLCLTKKQILDLAENDFVSGFYAVKNETAVQLDEFRLIYHVERDMHYTAFDSLKILQFSIRKADGEYNMDYDVDYNGEVDSFDALSALKESVGKVSIRLFGIKDSISYAHVKIENK